MIPLTPLQLSSDSTSSKRGPSEESHTPLKIHRRSWDSDAPSSLRLHTQLHQKFKSSNEIEASDPGELARWVMGAWENVFNGYRGIQAVKMLDKLGESQENIRLSKALRILYESETATVEGELGWVRQLVDPGPGCDMLRQGSDFIPIEDLLKEADVVISGSASSIVDIAQGARDHEMDCCDWDNPTFLLYELGHLYPEDKIHNLIPHGGETYHVIAPSRNGKTRSSYESLCSKFGLYFTFEPGPGYATGSRDVKTALESLPAFSGGGPGQEQAAQKASERIWLMLLAARLLVFLTFLQDLPDNTPAPSARRRWVLLQACPPCPTYPSALPTSSVPTDDLFTALFRVFRPASHEDVSHFVQRHFSKIQTKLKCLFPSDPPSLTEYIDEAHHGAVEMPHFYQHARPRNALQDFYMLSKDVGIFDGFVIHGTSLSNVTVKRAFGPEVHHTMKFIGPPSYARLMSNRSEGMIWNHTNFFDTFRRQIAQNSPSSHRLQKRVEEYLVGCPGFTTMFIEILLRTRTQTKSHHRLLTQYIYYQTGFLLTDAEDLEMDEAPLPQKILDHIGSYGCVKERLSGLGRKIDSTTHRYLMSVLYCWIDSSQSTFIPIETGNSDDDPYALINLGIAHLAPNANPSSTHLPPVMNMPMVICEPLVVMALGNIFEDERPSTHEQYPATAIAQQSSDLAIGSDAELIIGSAIMQFFGGQARRLDEWLDVNHAELSGRQVRLVAFTEDEKTGKLRSHCVSPRKGPSPRLGFRSTSPKHTDDFFQNPGGKVFLYPDQNFGADLVFWVQDEDTGEFMLILTQIKATTRPLGLSACLDAVRSVTWDLIYTVRGENNERIPYALKKYPHLVEGLDRRLNDIAGAATEEPNFRPHSVRNLRSNFKGKDRDVTNPNGKTRKIPRVLSVIAQSAPDKTLRAHLHRIPTAASLKWEIVERYLGSMSAVLGPDRRQVIPVN